MALAKVKVRPTTGLTGTTRACKCYSNITMVEPMTLCAFLFSTMITGATTFCFLPSAAAAIVDSTTSGAFSFTFFTAFTGAGFLLK